jgi:hypothetical protein
VPQAQRKIASPQRDDLVGEGLNIKHSLRFRATAVAPGNAFSEAKNDA